MEAVKYLSQLTGFNVDLGSVDEDREAQLKKERERNKFIENMSNLDDMPTLDESLVVSSRFRGCSYFLDKGFTQSVVDYFELGTITDEFGIDRASVPIRDEYGRLVSISGRRTDNDDEPRYLLVKNFQKRRVLYNFHNIINHPTRYEGTVIIVEGFKALWYVHSAGFKNAVAVMGSSISTEQVNLLVKYGLSCAILLLDGDEKGRLGMQRSQERMKGKINCVPVYLPSGLSPDDIEFSEIRDLVSLFL